MTANGKLYIFTVVRSVAAVGDSDKQQEYDDDDDFYLKYNRNISFCC